MSMRITGSWGTVGLLAVLLLPGCGDPSTTASLEAEAGGATGGAIPGGPVEVAPDIALEDLDGNEVALSQYDGHVRLIDFWATWCAPCREEIPMFKELHEKYGAQGFTLVAVSMDDGGAEDVRPFIEEFEIPYLNLIGNAEAEQAFGGIPGYPTAFLVDREGRIVERMTGAKPRRLLERRIRELLGLEA